MRRLINETDTVPAVLQIESNPRIHNELLNKFCKKHGIIMCGYSPFGSPDLPWGEKLPHVLVDPTLMEIAKKYERSTAQIVLRWQLQRGIAVIPKVKQSLKIIFTAIVRELSLQILECH